MAFAGDADADADADADDANVLTNASVQVFASSRALMSDLFDDIERLCCAKTELVLSLPDTGVDAGVDAGVHTDVRIGVYDAAADSGTDAADVAATRALERCAAHAIAQHERMIARVEEFVCASACTHTDSPVADVLPDTADRSVRVDLVSWTQVQASACAARTSSARVLDALETAALLLNSHPSALAHACSEPGLGQSIDMQDDRSLNLGLVFFETQGLCVPDNILRRALCAHGTGDRVIARLLASAVVAKSAGDAWDALSGDLLPETPLTFAVKASLSRTIIQTLLTCPSVVRTAGTPDLSGNTPLMWACISNNHNHGIIADLLACETVRATAATATNHFLQNALLLAVDLCQAETVQEMLQRDTNGLAVKAAESLCCPGSLLTRAMTRANVSLIRVLLACPSIAASAGDVTNTHETPLMIAARVEFRFPCALIVTLLECPQVAATADARNPHGETALIVASRLNKHYVVAALLESDAVSRTAALTDASGNTALMTAVLNEDFYTLCALLNSTAVVSTISVKHRITQLTALDMARAAAANGGPYANAIFATLRDY